ncbi:hypothetical protein XELAEV_18044467mg [Xenopus laevis]|uniref:Lysine-specific metallo-endopeptidase domain-containing protein n=1 Tax=Xenopus laevis TaxID=8355 RepID=A0A974BYY3_XENLA|nr:hypothetical protein XELAEV_18044467mg [Xenopus laevis]
MDTQMHCDSFLSEDESKIAEDAKQRTQRILTDALNKRSCILVEEPENIAQPYKGHCPILSVRLVQDLLEELHKVTFRHREMHVTEDWIAYVYPASSKKIIYLCPKFWSQCQYLQKNSCPGTLLHEVSHFLGYEHRLDKPHEGGSHNLVLQQKLCPLTNYTLELAFSVYMNHSQPYTDGQYHCCGERDRDSVCEKSQMSREIRQATKRPLVKKTRRKVM